MAIGWIKLHRQIQECDLWDSEDEPFDRRSAWIDLLLLANHEDKKIIFNGKPLTVKAGQRITSLRKLAERWNWSVNRVKRYLDLLEKLNMIVRESDNRKTLLTVVKYEVYQSQRYTDEYTNEHTDEHADGYTDGTQTNTQTDIKQEIKNDKNDKKNIYGEYRHVLLKQTEYEKLVSEYGDQMTNDCIRYLDEYIEMKGYKAKSHYLCIRKWVVEAVKEKSAKKNQFNRFPESETNITELEKKIYAN